MVANSTSRDLGPCTLEAILRGPDFEAFAEVKESDRRSVSMRSPLRAHALAGPPRSSRSFFPVALADRRD